MEQPEDECSFLLTDCEDNEIIDNVLFLKLLKCYLHKKLLHSSNVVHAVVKLLDLKSVNHQLKQPLKGRMQDSTKQLFYLVFVNMLNEVNNNL